VQLVAGDHGIHQEKTHTTFGNILDHAAIVGSKLDVHELRGFASRVAASFSDFCGCHAH
jgi:hypothetical protein